MVIELSLAVSIGIAVCGAYKLILNNKSEIKHQKEELEKIQKKIEKFDEYKNLQSVVCAQQKEIVKGNTRDIENINGVMSEMFTEIKKTNENINELKIEFVRFVGIYEDKNRG